MIVEIFASVYWGKFQFHLLGPDIVTPEFPDGIQILKMKFISYAKKSLFAKKGEFEEHWTSKAN